MNNRASILIVDDEEVVRRSHLRSLAGTGCRAEAAGDGTEALRVMEQHPFDVVLLDLRMPGLDGMEVLKTIKARWPESEVVIITGYPTLDSAKEAVRLGAQNYLAKPVGPDDVIRAANDAVMHKRWTIRSDPEDRAAKQSASNQDPKQAVIH
ncbi:MAG: response regulator [Xanthomonadales bacterium]|nr:response regulator [Xanthomonadales bacterium]